MNVGSLDDEENDEHTGDRLVEISLHNPWHNFLGTEPLEAYIGIKYSPTCSKHALLSRGSTHQQSWAITRYHWVSQHIMAYHRISIMNESGTSIISGIPWL